MTPSVGSALGDRFRLDVLLEARGMNERIGRMNILRFLEPSHLKNYKLTQFIFRAVESAGRQRERDVVRAGDDVEQAHPQLLRLRGGGGKLAGARGQARCVMSMADAEVPL